MLWRRLRRVLARRISSDRADGMLAQALCYIGAISIVAAVGRLVHLFARTPFEVLAILLLDLLLAISLVILGITVGCHANRATPVASDSSTSKQNAGNHS